MISNYYNFLVYCNKRKTFCKGYQRLKKDRFRGYIDQHSYVKSLRQIHRAALELELDYFDILHMRL
ncbi:hypothetical protein [Flagellimonas nanhaiensis]|uniref:Uncharacterized protein n=1 Tax=Flagellimonas nanhaiensis TaxID=2292706 RepID=A0A371JTR4_9FLAO|nr:hypothetical protein [Allomuricauda nanhaiensis]RDY61187.1 hypothetical protein DX873_03185 [Allomuricauda nanhaiensis]